MDLTMNKFGKCQQFTRTSVNYKDIRGAWEKPTIATRGAYEFFIAKKCQRKSETNRARVS